MNVEFQDTSVALADRELIVRSNLVNRTSEHWSHAAGWNTGYHLFDDPTGTLVIDGEREPLELAAGSARKLESRITLPPEPGVYAVYVSVMQEHVAWFYDRGWPFILIDVVVDDAGQATLQRWRVVDRSVVRRRRLMRSLANGFTLPVGLPWQNRSLIRTLVRRDIMSRYAGSAGGAFWTILNPLLLMLTYFFVFGVVLHARVPGDPSATGWAFYFLAGMMPWLAFSDALARAPGILIEHRNFIRKLVFPVETLPVNLVATGLVTEFFGIAILLIGLLLVRHSLPPTLIYLPVLAIPQILMTAGFCWFLAAMGVFARDLSQINGYLLTIWFFVTPICYTERQLATAWPLGAKLMALNPIYVLVANYRRVILENTAPDWPSVLWTTVFSIAIFLGGHAWFRKLRRSFADLI